STPIPDDGGDDPTMEQVKKRAKWDNDDYVCRGLIINGMFDPLFDIYHNVESSKELWDSLEAKYMAKDASSKKLLVSNFTNYKITDSRPVMEQYNEVLGILGRFTQHTMNMDEAIKVSCVIDKLPPSWKDFKHTLKHKKEELTLVELGSHLRIEESLKKYGKNGYIKRDCKGVNVGNKVNGSGTKCSVDGSSNSPKGATVHVCKDRCWFKTYESLNDGSILHMGNELTTLVYGRGCVDIRFSSVKIVSLFNVLHVPSIRKNLVSSSVLNNCGYKQDEALDKFKVFKTEVKLQQGSLIKRFKTNRGGEYMDTLYFQSVGIIHETTAPYTPQQNGISERKNMVLKEMVNSMLSYSGLSQGFWGEAMAVVRLPDPKLKTLGERGIEFIFVGYVEHSKAFRFYVIEPNESILVNSIIESRDAIFDENRFSSVPRSNLRIPNGTEDIVGSVVPKEVTKEVVQQPKPELRKSKRNMTPKNFGPEFKLYLIEGTRDKDVAFWKKAINDEMDSIMGNNTWVSADLPPGCKPLGYKWIFKRKLKVYGTIKKFKARLVIQEFRQKSGIDYFDIYAPVARISTIRLLIDMASIHNLIIHQMDVKTVS
ncbi:zinc finger, CCHC-type containing protein, partial [Tanacetum coccineum]